MRVAVQASLRISVAVLVPHKVPDDQSLIAASGEEHIGVLEACSE